MSLTLWQPRSSDATRLKTETVVAILGKLHARYGAKFADMWQGVPQDKLAAEWAAELAGFTPDEIRRGMDACRTRVWPPTLPEFAALCRPPIEAEAAFYEALDGIRQRERGVAFAWSHPAIYWAAVDFGTYNLTHSDWPAAKSKWVRILAKQMDKTEWEAVPDPPAAYLPPPERRHMPDHVRKQLAGLMKEWNVSKTLAAD